MKFYFNITKYFDDGNSINHKYEANVFINENFAVNIIDLVNKSFLMNHPWEELGIISTFKDHVTIVIDDTEIVIKSEDKFFDFEKYEVELYDEFAKIRY